MRQRLRERAVEPIASAVAATTNTSGGFTAAASTLPTPSTPSYPVPVDFTGETSGESVRAIDRGGLGFSVSAI